MEEMEWNGIERGNSMMAERCTFHAHKQVDTLRWKKWNGIKIHKMEGGGGGVVILKKCCTYCMLNLESPLMKQLGSVWWQWDGVGRGTWNVIGRYNVALYRVLVLLAVLILLAVLVLLAVLILIAAVPRSRLDRNRDRVQCGIASSVRAQQHQ